MEQPVNSASSWMVISRLGDLGAGIVIGSGVGLLLKKAVSVTVGRRDAH